MNLICFIATIICSKKESLPCTPLDYKAKAESSETIENYFATNGHPIKYLLSVQIILYLLVIIGEIIVTCCLFWLKIIDTNTGNCSAETDMSAETKNEVQIQKIEAKWKERTGYHSVFLI